MLTCWATTSTLDTSRSGRGTAVQRCAVRRVRRVFASRLWSSAPHRNSVRRLPGTALS